MARYSSVLICQVKVYTKTSPQDCFPRLCYGEALYMSFSGLESLKKRRFAVSRRFISEWRLLVMKLLLYHMILDLATRLEPKERMILLPLNF